MALFVLAMLLLATLGADRPPWRVRKRPGAQPNRLAAVLVHPDDWPAEPASPVRVDAKRFAEALHQICGYMPPSRPQTYAGYVLAAATEFSIDPFLLAALMYRESHCRANKEEDAGLGLTLLIPSMYRHFFHGRDYRYHVRQAGQWQERILALSRYPFSEAMLKKAEPNLYFAAALLSAWRDQELDVHAVYPQMPHRHFVSHFIWGDRVKSDRAEDRILTDRRRLLEYYGVRSAPEPIAALGLQLHAPLDGAPRVVSSGLGSDRDGGERSHRGIDIESEFGEPVRAVADGKVIFVGVDLPGHHHNESMSPDEVNDYPLRPMGRGGRYLCINHEGDGSAPAVRSCYMHLNTVEVAAGDMVTGGQRIGAVGRSGMKRSAPHLHLEFRTMEALLDPLEHLQGHVIGKPAEPDGPEVRAFRHASEVLYRNL